MEGQERTTAVEQLRLLSAQAEESSLRETLRALSGAVLAGNIQNSTGVAIGNQIRQVVYNVSIPAEAAGALAELRLLLDSGFGLNAELYQLGSLVAERAKEFVGREYVFTALDAFMARHKKGYFVIVADPGMGKSSIVAELVRRKACISHFNVRSLGVNTATHFLRSVCAQLIVDAGLPYPQLPSEAVKDGAFLSRLMKEAAEQIESGPLVIAIDALDEVEEGEQSRGANILFLPKTLPDNVYVVMTRRKAEVPLVTLSSIETLDMMEHPEENRDDAVAFLERAAERPELRSWIERHPKQGDQPFTRERFVHQLATLSENNFMYLHYVLPEIERGDYSTLDADQLPSGLQGYYDDHWRLMGMRAQPLPRAKILILYVLCEVRHPISRRMIADCLAAQGIDDLAVQGVLDQWQQFLTRHASSTEATFSVYHASFRDFLHRKDVMEAAATTLPDIHRLISQDLLAGLYGQASDVLSASAPES
jgi:hypothetical protein